MKSVLHNTVRRAAVRCHAQLLAAQAGRWLALAAAAGLAALLSHRLLGVGAFPPALAGALATGAILAAGVSWYRRRPGPLEVAVMIDRRLSLRERVSSAWSLRASDDDFARAACAEASERIRGLRVSSAFPVRPTAVWAWAAGAWLALAVGFFLLPELDLLGYLARDRREDRRQDHLRQARTDVEQAQQKLTPIVKALKNPELSAELAKLADTAHLEQAQDVQRQAVRKLTEMSDKLKQLQDSPSQQAFQEFQDLLRGLRSPSDGLRAEMNRQIASGEFAKAAQTLRELQKQIEENQLGQKDEAALARQLQDLSRQLAELSQDDAALRQALERVGLNGELAGLGGEQLRRELCRQGLTKEKIEELLRQAQASQAARELARKLVRQLDQAAPEGKPISVVDLSQFADQIEMLDGEAEQGRSCQLTREEIEKLIEHLGRGGKLQLQKGKGAGESDVALALPGQEGEGGALPGVTGEGGEGEPAGGSAPGHGSTKRDAPDIGQARLAPFRADSTGKSARAVASWYFRGPQVTGESKLELRQTLQAAKDQAAEAITENQIPRKYESAVRKYFAQLEEESEK